MSFFEDFNVDLREKIGITNLLSNITTREGSHKGGWARLLKCQLTNLGYQDVKILDNKDSICDFDVIIFDLGAEYSGSLNLFGGLDDKVYKRLFELRNFKGEFFSWKHALPNVHDGLKSRRENKSTCERFRNEDPGFLGHIQSNLERTRTFDHAYRTESLLIGDSHTPSVWTPQWMIERQDGRTLYGSLQKSLISELVTKYNPKSVMIHMSSIDVRHHLARLPEPERSTTQLVTGLVNQVTPLSSFFQVNQVTVVHTMGIEDESRELPKTGYYKGTPFAGSWETRNRIRCIYNEMLNECSKLTGWDVQDFPEYFFDESGKLRFEVMEKPQSVHLSPEHYRWDLDKNELRWSREHDIKMITHFATKGLVQKIEKDMYESR